VANYDLYTNNCTGTINYAIAENTRMTHKSTLSMCLDVAGWH